MYDLEIDVVRIHHYVANISYSINQPFSVFRTATQAKVGAVVIESDDSQR